MRCAARGAGGCAAGRSFAGVAGCSGWCFLRFTPRGVVVVARRGDVSLACYSGGCFQRFAPRGVLRWCGARGVLRWCGTRGAPRPLFLLRSCAADQEKRPEKKSRAVMACASVQLERPGNMCIRSAPHCISRGQREEGIFLRGRDFGDRFMELGSRCGVKFPVVLPPRAAPCSVTETGAAGCCRIHTSEVSLPAAPCAPLCGARGAAPVLRTPPLLREPRPFFWAAFLSLRRLRCGKKSRGSGLLTAAFVNLNVAPLKK